MGNLREIKRDARRIVREALESDTWYGETDSEGNPVKRTFLGSVFSLFPSGKYYMPWANSNVNPCPRCKGKGCNFCSHLGSREAYEDEIFGETLEKAAGKKEGWIESGEGDATDIFLCLPGGS